MALVISTVCVLRQSPGAEEFAALSLLIAPQPGSFHVLDGIDHPQFVPAVRAGVGRSRRGLLLVSMLAHEVDSRERTFTQAAQEAVELPLQAAAGPLVSVPQERLRERLGSSGRWMIEPPSALPATQGPPVLSQYRMYRPNLRLHLLVGVRGNFLPCALEPPIQSQRHTLQKQLPSHCQLLDLRWDVGRHHDPAGSIQSAIQGALFQAAQIYS